MSRPIPVAPGAFDGRLDALFRDHIVGVLPDVDVVCRFHDRLVDYVSRHDPLFVVRTVVGLERGATIRLPAGRIRPSDNSPAWMIHRLLFDGLDCRDAEHFADVMSSGVPCHFHQMARIATVNGAGWHVAHIFNAKDGDVAYQEWTRAGLVRRFVRNLHPCNCFYIPKTDWSRHGGHQSVLAFAAAVYRQRYHRIWPAFLGLAGASDLENAPSAGAYRLAFSPTGPRALRVSTASDASAVVEYHANRLLFRRTLIERLMPEQRFRVATRDHGVFEFSRSEFERVFANILLTASWQRDGVYHMAIPPKKAKAFLIQPPE